MSVGVSAAPKLSEYMTKAVYVLNGIIGSFLLKKIASATKRHEIAAIAYGSTTAYTKRQTIAFTNGLHGVARFTFKIYNYGGGTTCYCIMTQNGVAPGGGSDIGVVQTHNDTTPTLKSQDIAVDFDAGDTVDLWTKCSAVSRSYEKEWEILYDNGNHDAVAVTGAD